MIIFLGDIQFQEFGHLITKNEHTLYQEKDYIRKIYTSLRKHTKNIINFEKEKMFLLTREKFK